MHDGPADRWRQRPCLQRDCHDGACVALEPACRALASFGALTAAACARSGRRCTRASARDAILASARRPMPRCQPLAAHRTRQPGLAAARGRRGGLRRLARTARAGERRGLQVACGVVARLAPQRQRPQRGRGRRAGQRQGLGAAHHAEQVVERVVVRAGARLPARRAAAWPSGTAGSAGTARHRAARVEPGSCWERARLAPSPERPSEQASRALCIARSLLRRCVQARPGRTPRSSTG